MASSSTARRADPLPRRQPGFVFSLYHGPDRHPVPPAGDETLTEAGVPFHGIASRGLLGEIGEPEDWSRFAHRLHDGSPSDEPVLLGLREAAQRLHVLSFRQSARAAERYLEARLPPKGPRLCELWNIKEGHTSSVWHVVARDEDGFEEFILNVARDDEAGRELARTAQTMMAIGQRHADLAMAGVEDIAEVEIDYSGEPLMVTVTRNELVRDGLEIHLGRHRQTGEPTLVVVERFLTEPDNPAEIARLVGRVMTNAECLRLEEDLAAFIDAASEIAEVAVDINEGDLVWAGDRAVVVAIR
jgi:hypothetical protein